MIIGSRCGVSRRCALVKGLEKISGIMGGYGGTSDQFGYILRYVLKGVEFRFVETKKSWKKVRMGRYNGCNHNSIIIFV